MIQSSKSKILAEEIRSFLAKHANKSACEKDKYSSPDASMLAQAASALEADLTIPNVWSSWGSQELTVNPNGYDGSAEIAHYLTRLSASRTTLFNSRNLQIRASL